MSYGDSKGRAGVTDSRASRGPAGDKPEQEVMGGTVLRM